MHKLMLALALSAVSSVCTFSTPKEIQKIATITVSEESGQLFIESGYHTKFFSNPCEVYSLINKSILSFCSEEQARIILFSTSLDSL